VSALALSLAAPLFTALAAALAAVTAASGRGRSPAAALGPYGRWWRARCDFLRAGQAVRAAVWATPASIAAGALCLVAGRPIWAAAAALAAVAAPVLLKRRADRRRAALAEQLDGTLTALANSLAISPSLGDSLRSLLAFVEPPMRDEIRDALAEVDLGRPIDDALLGLARRVTVPGFEVAIAAAVTGRRTGGNLAEILQRTARSLREMARLEGVVRTKTAEGRNQALVMGMVPPVLIAALQKIDPTWLVPMWTDPIGWILLGVAALLEVAAVALIRKIMAVDI
jgi:tight adherence protein B